MSDIALTWSNDAGAADLSLSENDLLADEGLETAALISLFLDRRAEYGDVLPEGETSRRGWWADTEADKIGSRLWLLDRAKETPDTLARAEEYAREAFDWMVEDQVLTRVDVVAEFLPRPLMGLALEITFYRPATDPVKFRFNRAWDAQALARP